MDYIPVLGDIFLCDSSRFGARVVKFFMQSPNVYLQIWRYIFHNLDIVRYYHCGLIVGNQIIEQQSVVKYGETKKILSRKIMIYRKKNLTEQQRYDICQSAINDLGEGYGILSVIGKFLTWLTGIPLFEDLMHIGDKDICVNRIAYWYFKSNKELFGQKNFKRTTTKTMDEYCSKSPNWEVVYEN
jgi:hypothetical protein